MGDNWDTDLSYEGMKAKVNRKCHVSFVSLGRRRLAPLLNCYLFYISHRARSRSRSRSRSGARSRSPSRSRNSPTTTPHPCSEECKEPSQTNTEPLRPTKNPPRVKQVYLRSTECPLCQIEGLHELIEGPRCPTECPLIPAHGMVRPTKDILGVLQGLLKPHSGLQFTQAYKGNSQASSGPASADKGPSKQHGTLSCRENAIFGKKGPFRPKEGSPRVAQGTFRPA